MKTHPQYEPWLQGMLIIAKYYRLDFSAEHVRVTINHESQSPRQLVLEEMARQLGLGMRWVAAEAVSLDPWRLPLLAEFTGGQIAVINRMDNDGNVSVQFSGDGGAGDNADARRTRYAVKGADGAASPGVHAGCARG